MNLPLSLHRFFFARQSAIGFGLMRIAWASIVLITFIVQSKDILFFYGDHGLMTADVSALLRSEYRWSVLSGIHSPVILESVYGLFIFSLSLMLLGIAPRISTIVSVLLLYSFHERMPFVLGGGDTVLRTVGFILMLAPSIDECSFSRCLRQMAHFRKTKTLLPSLTMSLWPYRLLLWQIIIIYGMSLWDKLRGTTWIRGTAAQIALHHPTFARSIAISDMLSPSLMVIAYATLVFEALWIGLLIPKWLTSFFPEDWQHVRLKRILIGCGIVFHGAIFALMEAGSFSLAMMMAYIGLLRDDDREWLRVRINTLFKKNATHSIVVLFDGHCGLCTRSTAILLMTDWLQRLHPVDFRDEHTRRTFAHDVTEKALDKALHIKLPNGTYLLGFDAFRALTWHLPMFWICAPLLYLPFVAPIGRTIYAHIAKNRQRCTHEHCRVW